MPPPPIPVCPFEHSKDPVLEAAQVAETTELTVKLLDMRYPAPAVCLRGVHPKSHGCVAAQLVINPDIDPSLQVGLFATPGKTFQARVRFSDATGTVTSDVDPSGTNNSRGMAVKVFDVGGEVLSDDKGAHNQDFLMINQPVFAFSDTREYVRLDRVLVRDKDVGAGFFAPLQLANPSLDAATKKAIQEYMVAENITPEDVGRILNTFKIVQGIQQTYIANPLEVQYFSAAPFLFGADRVMKFSVRPMKKSPPVKQPPSSAPDYLGEELRKTMQGSEAVVFDFMVQVRRDVNAPDMGIEDATALWDEASHPFVKVATLTIPCPQPDVGTQAEINACRDLVFTPWHSLVEHQPIGSINRLRKPVYEASAARRAVAPAPIWTAAAGRAARRTTSNPPS